MKVIVNTDKNVTLTEESIGAMQSQVESTLRNFESQLTRVEVHLSDESAGRSTGNDIRCNLEARPEGRDPEFATNNADSVDEALSGALQKMIQVLDSSFGRLDTRKGGSSMGGIEPR
ncbi:MAG: HPF/RaiA family ribosome-associated protein [Microbacteriaceae bacterium]|nr:HPF/RaiA family ribosome-associated protein [Microbacteriaceae bacterium]